jgi:hypothetical protein
MLAFSNLLFHVRFPFLNTVYTAHILYEDYVLPNSSYLSLKL